MNLRVIFIIIIVSFIIGGIFFLPHAANKKPLEKVAAVPLPPLPDLGQAPEFAGISQWLNTSPLTLAELKGNVVLVDFWTYSCVNCVRTFPHVVGWYEKYKNDHFIVVGVHTPEFDFEKKTENIEKALKRFKITYPVAQDNSKLTWNAYHNKYWPAKYLIDANGKIRYTHFGEGDYEETEGAIRSLLQEIGNQPNAEMVTAKEEEKFSGRTPETYLGKKRMERFASNEKVYGGTQVFTAPQEMAPDHFAYEGAWNLSAESAKSEKGSALIIKFNAAKVFLVLGPATAGDHVKVLLDEKPVDVSKAGSDVVNGEVIVDEERLYQLIDLKEEAGVHVLRLRFETPGTAVYAFTFG